MKSYNTACRNPAKCGLRPGGEHRIGSQAHANCLAITMGHPNAPHKVSVEPPDITLPTAARASAADREPYRKASVSLIRSMAPFLRGKDARDAAEVVSDLAVKHPALGEQLSAKRPDGRATLVALGDVLGEKIMPSVAYDEPPTAIGRAWDFVARRGAPSFDGAGGGSSMRCRVVLMDMVDDRRLAAEARSAALNRR